MQNTPYVSGTRSPGCVPWQLRGTLPSVCHGIAVVFNRMVQVQDFKVVIWGLLAKAACVYMHCTESLCVWGPCLDQLCWEGHSPYIASQVSSSIKTGCSPGLWGTLCRKCQVSQSMMTRVAHSSVMTDPKEHRMVGIKRSFSEIDVQIHGEVRSLCMCTCVHTSMCSVRVYVCVCGRGTYLYVDTGVCAHRYV